MISTPDAVLQTVIKRALIDSGCPVVIVTELMENSHERHWPPGLSTLEARQLNRRVYENYICKRIPGNYCISSFLHLLIVIVIIIITLTISNAITRVWRVGYRLYNISICYIISLSYDISDISPSFTIFSVWLRMSTYNKRIWWWWWWWWWTDNNRQNNNNNNIKPSCCWDSQSYCIWRIN